MKRNISLKYPQANSMQRWPVLKPGDIVDVVAPASACSRAELSGAIRYLKNLGYRPRVAKNIFSSKVKIFAQTDEQRLLQLKRALQAVDSKIVWCVRGGYGVLRLLPDLSKVRPPRQSKILLGFSDITTLHSFLQSEWHWPTLHGPLLDRFGRKANQPQETKELWGLLSGQKSEVIFKGLTPLNAAARKNKTIKSSVVGGTLAVLQSSLGTPWQRLPDGHIVFFEDTGERPHRLDRMLTQMQQAGYFRRAKAVVFGPLLVADKKDSRLIMNDVLPRFAASLKIPVLRNLPCGHGAKQRPLPLLTPATLKLGGRPQLIVKAGRRRAP